ncbi:MAG: DUF4363 family protein [Clostridia bacterium]|nr:DUF4363 family protein [Clostridia bacterium]
MKYLYIGILILALTLALSIVLVTWMDICISRTVRLLEKALDACDREDTALAYEKGREAEALWKKYDGLLGVVLDHAEADGITFGIAEMNSYAVTDTLSDFRRCCAEVCAQMHHVSQKEWPFYYNLL